MKSELPLVYSCSGCSSAAQMANSIALRLDREGHAEMSCISEITRIYDLIQARLR
jgi:uncharacterized metal-binding protein